LLPVIGEVINLHIRVTDHKIRFIIQKVRYNLIFQDGLSLCLFLSLYCNRQSNLLVSYYYEAKSID